ncbi:MAG TPA: hypothetical protein VL460_00495 [Caulobacteraceae bacterium]|jgi:hypothetical protein|nr:hypothetical protein [Caulobacteraceae bacterium]
MERRDVLKLGSLALMGLAIPESAPEAAPAQDLSGDATTFLHCWADEKGVTHVAIKPISKAAKPLPFASQMDLHFDGVPLHPQHKSPHPQFVVTLQGEFEVEGSDGSRLKAPASGLTYMEDTTGEGHTVRLVNAVNINLPAPEKFDVLAWARGEG